MTVILELDKAQLGKLLKTLDTLPRRVVIKHLRIALNAWGGVVRDVARPLAAQESGLLKKSLAVKVIIPDASKNTAHHGRPARVLVGPSRKVVGNVVNKAGAFKTVGAKRAEKLKAEGAQVRTRKPSRYAHLVEKGTTRGAKPKPFIGPAQAAGATAGLSKLTQKLSEGLAQEAAAHAAK